MTDVSLISPKQETQLLNALTGAIKDVNAGTPVNEALAKQANANGFGPEFAQRMVEAYNASKTIKHIGSTDGEKRAESFELADPKQVVDHMYADGIETKVVKAASQNIVDPASVNFNTNPESELRSSRIEKVAHFVEEEKKDDSPYAKSAEMRIAETTASARDFMQKISLAREELRREEQGLQDHVQGLVEKLAEAFCYTDADPFNEVEYRVRGKYGNAFGKQAMDIIWAQKDFERYNEKRAAVIADRPTVMGTGTCYKLADEYMQGLKALAEKRAEAAQFTKKADLAEAWLKKNIANLNKVGANVEVKDYSKGSQAAQRDVRSQGRRGNKASPKATDTGDVTGKRKTSAPAGGGGTNILGKGMKTPLGPLSLEPTSLIDTVVSDQEPEVESPVTPQHESKLRQIRVKLMLNDMIANDPVISAYSPEDTFAAYNQVAEMVPGLSTEPLLMRALVARILQSGSRLEAHEVSDLLQAEEKRRKTRILGY